MLMELVPSRLVVVRDSRVAPGGAAPPARRPLLPEGAADRGVVRRDVVLAAEHLIPQQRDPRAAGRVESLLEVHRDGRLALRGPSYLVDRENSRVLARVLVVGEVGA